MLNKDNSSSDQSEDQGREDSQPTVELLFLDGLTSIDERSQGNAPRQKNREAPLGQILVEGDIDEIQYVQNSVDIEARKHMRLGDILIREGVISQESVKIALAEQKKRQGKRIGELLLEMNLVSEEALFRTLARKFHIPFVDLDQIPINAGAVHHVDKSVLRKYEVLPIDISDKTIMIAISDPLNIEIHDIFRFIYKRDIQEVIARPAQIKRYIETLLKSNDVEEIDNLIQQLRSTETDVTEIEDAISETISESDNAIVQLVNQIISQAYHRRASDIHVEPNGPREKTRIRFRVEGECQVYRTIPANLWQALVSRIKIMAQLDITERRKPQDGKIRLKIGNKHLELRVATIPTANGNEDVVMRILTGSKPLPVDNMGLSDRNLTALRKCIVKPYGLILCVGPTGSGKTTTLHALLGELNTVSTKIWTAEDPVEITQPGLRQVQVHPKINFTFAAAMRAFLRADPDIIMIGEMRDRETANIAVEASLTGHLVLSTLHTNSAPETITRLLDMGLEPFTFSDALVGIIAQRLVRKICKECREQYPAKPEEQEIILSVFGEQGMKEQLNTDKPDHVLLWHAKGCEVCAGTGFHGRMAIQELLVNDDKIKYAIQHHGTAAEIRDLAVLGGMTTLIQDGIAKALRGETNLKQVLAVCGR